MSWSHSSELLIVALLVAAAVAPAAAVTVSTADSPEEAEVGERITVQYTIEELYQNPQTDAWTLGGETELEDPTWTVEFYNQQGALIESEDFGGSNISADGVDPEQGVAEVQVTVVGTVPEISEHTYPEEETFLVARLQQVRAGGTLNTIDSWQAHHYSQESTEARQAIAEAEDAIAEAEDAGVDVSDEQDTLLSAISVYDGENANPSEATNLANQAADNAESARQEAQQAESRNQLLMYGGGALIALLAIAGVAYWYLNSRDSYDKLG